MHNRKSGLRLAVAVVLSAMLAACAGKKSTLHQPEPQLRVAEQPATTEAPRVFRDLTFPDPLFIPPEMAIDDPTDPTALVKFALMLIERGEVQRAAAFFLDAAHLPQAASLHNTFRIATLAAAASCYLQTGDMDNFRRVVRHLQQSMDRFQAATLQPELAVLLAIAAKGHGDDVGLPATVPLAIQHLFQDQ
jgi:hypothetical protein